MSDRKVNGPIVTVALGSPLFLLGLLFLALKFTGYIDWSWWLVTLPFWGPSAFVMTMIVGFFGVVGLSALLASMRASRKKF